MPCHRAWRWFTHTAAAPEAHYAQQFEAPELLTLGILYEQDRRIAGGAYSSFLRKVERFSDRSLSASVER